MQLCWKHRATGADRRTQMLYGVFQCYHMLLTFSVLVQAVQLSLPRLRPPKDGIAPTRLITAAKHADLLLAHQSEAVVLFNHMFHVHTAKMHLTILQVNPSTSRRVKVSDQLSRGTRR